MNPTVKQELSLKATEQAEASRKNEMTPPSENQVESIVEKRKNEMTPPTVIQESIVEKKETEELSPKATEQAEEASRKRKGKNLPSENQVESKRNKRNDEIGEDEKIEEDKEENKKMRYTSTSSNETMNRLHQFCGLPEFVSVKQVIDAHTPFVGLMEKKLPSKLTQQVLATVMQKWKDGFYEHEPGTKYELGADLARKEFGIVEGGADAMELQISESCQRTSLVHKALRWTEGKKSKNIKSFDMKTMKKKVFDFFENWKSESGTKPEPEVESGTKPEPEVLARLYFALSFCDFFFSEAHRVNDAYFHLLDDLKNLKRYRWDKAIVAFLTKGMDLAYTKTQKNQDRSDTQINGCAFLIEKFQEENNIPLIKRDKKVAEVRNAEVRNQPRKDKKVAKVRNQQIEKFQVPNYLGRNCLKTLMALEIAERQCAGGNVLEVKEDSEMSVEIVKGSDNDGEVNQGSYMSNVMEKMDQFEFENGGEGYQGDDGEDKVVQNDVTNIKEVVTGHNVEQQKNDVVVDAVPQLKEEQPNLKNDGAKEVVTGSGNVLPETGHNVQQQKNDVVLKDDPRVSCSFKGIPFGIVDVGSSALDANWRMQTTYRNST